MKNNILIILFCLLLGACATNFDPTNIRPGQRVEGLGFSFKVPSNLPWFASVYGNSHRIRLNQLNDQDSYVIVAAVNKGPAKGMYSSADEHLTAFRYHKTTKGFPKGFIQHSQKEWIEEELGKLCIQYTSASEDWRGRMNDGPALIEEIGLSCAHPQLPNALVTFEISRRFETSAPEVNLQQLSRELFESIEYFPVD